MEDICSASGAEIDKHLRSERTAFLAVPQMKCSSEKSAKPQKQTQNLHDVSAQC